MSDTPGATLRPAEPDLDEGRTFARYLDVAAGGLYRAMLGRRYAEVVAKACLEPRHDLSYEHVTFAELGGEIVGMASAYTARQHAQSTDEPLQTAAGFRVLRMAAVALILRPALRFLDTVPEGDYYLQALAVNKSHRGQGIGAALIQFTEAQARATSSARLTLHVSAENPDARRLYERLGMAAEAESRSVLFLPQTRVIRMTKTL